MISIVSEPGNIAMARNSVLLRLSATQSSGQPYSAQGAAATLTAGAAARFATGNTLTITWVEPDATTTTIVFTAVASPVSETELPDASFAGTIAAYWERVRSIVADHHRIAAHFNVTRTGPTGGNVLRIQVRSLLSGWTLTVATTSGFAVAAVAAVADSTPSNYRVLVEVFGLDTYTGGTATQIAQLQGQPLPDGTLWFDLGSVLSAHCRATRVEPLCPVFGAPIPIRADNIRRYYYRVTEEFGDPPVVQAWVYGAVKRAMDGGVSQALHLIGPYLDGITADESLFTWQPDGQIVRPGAEHWLSWYNYTGATKSLLLEWQVWSSATGLPLGPVRYAPLDESIPPIPVTSAAPNEVIQFPLRDVLDTSAYADGLPSKVTVRVVDGASDWSGGNAEALSPVRTYYLDWSTYEAMRVIQWINGFGVVESMCVTGAITKSVAVERFTGRRELSPYATTLATDVYQYARAYRPTRTYRTGFIRRSDADALQEMLLAGDIYDVTAGGYTPLRLLTDTFRVTDTREDLHAYEFDAALRLDLLNYSNQSVVSPAVDDAWQDPAGDFWADALSMPWQTP